MSGKLVSLEGRHAQELETFLCEFDAKPSELHGYFCERDWPIDRAVHTLAVWGRGEELRGGRVPCSTWFWEDERALAGCDQCSPLSDGATRRVGRTHWILRGTQLPQQRRSHPNAGRGSRSLPGTGDRARPPYLRRRKHRFPENDRNQRGNIRPGGLVRTRQGYAAMVLDRPDLIGPVIPAPALRAPPTDPGPPSGAPVSLFSLYRTWRKM